MKWTLYISSQKKKKKNSASTAHFAKKSDQSTQSFTTSEMIKVPNSTEFIIFFTKQKFFNLIIRIYYVKKDMGYYVNL